MARWSASSCVCLATGPRISSVGLSPHPRLERHPGGNGHRLGDIFFADFSARAPRLLAEGRQAVRNPTIEEDRGQEVAASRRTRRRGFPWDRPWLGERAERLERRLELPMLVAAALVIPDLILDGERRRRGGPDRVRPELDHLARLPWRACRNA